MNILIIGMREKEVNRLVNKHKGKTLNFIYSNSINNRSLKDLCKYSYIIAMTKFCSHLTEYLCNSHPNYIRLKPTQGISTINSILETL